MQGGFQNSEFQNLKKVYSIWIVMNPNKAMEGVFNEYSINERFLRKKYHIPKTDYDKLSIVMIYLNKEYDINDDKHDLTEMLYILFQANMPAEDKKYQLSENYGIMMTRAIDEEVDDVCNLSEGIMEKGRIEMAIDNVCSLMTEMNKTLNEAMQILKIDESIQPEVEKAVKALTQSI